MMIISADGEHYERYSIVVVVVVPAAVIVILIVLSSSCRGTSHVASTSSGCVDHGA